MGLQKEIEAIFQRVVEADLERISRCAEPTYHFTTTPPLPTVQNPHGTASSGSVKVNFTAQDCQIVKIELNPFRIDPAELGDNLNVIEQRRRKRNVPFGDFESRLMQEDYDEAYHEYIEESQARDPLPITPKHLLVDDNYDVELPVIAFAGVCYVLKSYVDDYGKYLQIKDDIYNSPLASIDQWPEEIVLRRPDASALHYVRADVEYWDEQGQKVNLRLQP